MTSPSELDEVIERRLTALEAEVVRLRATKLDQAPGPIGRLLERIDGPMSCPAFPDAIRRVTQDEETGGWSVQVSCQGWLICGPERFSKAEAIVEWNRRWARVQP